MSNIRTPNADNGEQARTEVDAIMAAAVKLRDRAADADDPNTTTAYAFWQRFVRELDLLRPARCSAHGNIACPSCSRITAEYIDDGGNCTGCGVYFSTGMHWDTCPGRIRGAVYANRDEAMRWGRVS